MVVAQISDRKRWREAGVRFCKRKSGVSISTVQDILNGVPVKLSTLETFAQAMKN